MERSSGILLSISSLPSPYGIGTLGKAAYKFADFLKAAGQGYWQLLPLGPTSYGDSPYQSFSTYAGNPYFIDPDLLIKDKLLTKKEVTAYDWGTDPRHVDYGKIYEGRYPLLAKAKERGWERDAEAVAAFVAQNESWLPDYALFMALKRYFGMKAWLEWPEDVRTRQSEALERYRAELREDVELFTYIQFLFFRQWGELKRYINDLGIRIIGDLPIYVAMDSADVWAEPEMFRLDSRGFPTEVSGVPPDYFSADGQLWGNPLYNYEAMERDGFGWWLRRVGGAARMFDVIRIDHFRGFESFWAVPYGEKTARNGKWVKGPGMKLVGTLTGWFHNLSFIAEDLGYATPEVAQLLKDSKLPGMKVLEFAFNPNEPSDYLPHRYTENCVCYTGTHDNATLAEWLVTCDKGELAQAKRYLGLNEKEGLAMGVIRGGMGSVASLFIAQMQDYLGLGKNNRMNTPGTAAGNWTWRMLPGEAGAALARRLAALTEMYER
ncbi:MAG: 4-alpha-glucanotransferase [Oscillospiraceae bacterium]|nr:4-alpha-glucanotransferase [Oscillospiraceae bacterium]